MSEQNELSTSTISMCGQVLCSYCLLIHADGCKSVGTLLLLSQHFLPISFYLPLLGPEEMQHVPDQLSFLIKKQASLHTRKLFMPKTLAQPSRVSRNSSYIRSCNTLGVTH